METSKVSRRQIRKSLAKLKVLMVEVDRLEGLNVLNKEDAAETKVRFKTSSTSHKDTAPSSKASHSEMEDLRRKLHMLDWEETEVDEKLEEVRARRRHIDQSIITASAASQKDQVPREAKAPKRDQGTHWHDLSNLVQSLVYLCSIKSRDTFSLPSPSFPGSGPDLVNEWD